MIPTPALIQSPGSPWKRSHPQVRLLPSPSPPHPQVRLLPSPSPPHPQVRLLPSPSPPHPQTIHCLDGSFLCVFGSPQRLDKCCQHAYYADIALLTGSGVVPPVVTTTPDGYTYQPHLCQYFYYRLVQNQERNVGTLAYAYFTKRHDHTLLRLTWEGNLRRKSCNGCCTQWVLKVNGDDCTGFEKIMTSIISTTDFDIFAPTTVSGICYEAGGVPIGARQHLITFEVSQCDGSQIADAATGYLSTSRLIVEELPHCECVCGEVSVERGSCLCGEVCLCDFYWHLPISTYQLASANLWFD